MESGDTVKEKTDLAASPLRPLKQYSGEPHADRATPPIHPDVNFQQIYDYPWERDTSFKSGYLAILGPRIQHPVDNPVACDVDLLLHAQCFFFARQVNLPMPAEDSVQAYRAWMETKPLAKGSHESPLLDRPERLHASLYQQALSHGVSGPISSSRSDDFSLNPFAPSFVPAAGLHLPMKEHGTVKAPQILAEQPPMEPPYPTSFADIVDLITRNESIPGIEEVPDTVIDASLSPPNKLPLRRKPWEKEDHDQINVEVEIEPPSGKDPGSGLAQRESATVNC